MIQKLFKKLPKQKIRDRIFHQIKSLIATGKLLPEQKIPSEMELCSLFDVSRSSVREAILRLECLGFVEQRHGEGTFVKSATEAVVLDYMTEMAKEKEFLSGLMEIREVLEIWAARRAALKATDEDIKALKAIVGGMQTQSSTAQPQFKTNVSLHTQITVASQNPFLIHMMSSIQSWIGTVTSQVYRGQKPTPTLHSKLTQQHQRIVDAIAAGDAPGAEVAMAEHLAFASHRIENPDAPL